MNYVDLHIHSTYSDGKLSPQEIIEFAKRNKIDVISITDHNTLDAYSQDFTTGDIRVIPGVEIDINYTPEIQLLCYDFDLYDLDLIDRLKYIQGKRMQAKVKLVRALLRLNIIEKRDLDTVCKLNDFDHICRFLETKIEGMTKDEIRSEYFEEGKILYQYIPSLELNECIELIHNANGIVILAHPGRIHILREDMQDLFLQLIEHGVDGIECYHPDNDQSLTQFIKKFCEENGCLMTGGSDMHSIDTDYRVLSDSISIGLFD